MGLPSWTVGCVKECLKGKLMIATLPCPTCSKPIDISVAKWCTCLSKKLSVICPACDTCFCKLKQFPQQAEWNAALRWLLEDQTQEKFRRALESHSSDGLTSGKTVLVVDDDEEICLIAEYTIRKMGYKVMSASNGRDAMAMIEKFSPSIVLTDALMPVVDGRQLCRLIKKTSARIKVVIMSGLYTNSRYRVEALKEYEADEYLAKPINFQRLREVLKELSKAA